MAPSPGLNGFLWQPHYCWLQASTTLVQQCFLFTQPQYFPPCMWTAVLDIGTLWLFTDAYKQLGLSGDWIRTAPCEVHVHKAVMTTLWCCFILCLHNYHIHSIFWAGMAEVSWLHVHVHNVCLEMGAYIIIMHSYFVSIDGVPYQASRHRQLHDTSPISHSRHVIIPILFSCLILRHKSGLKYNVFGSAHFMCVWFKLWTHWTWK